MKKKSFFMSIALLIFTIVIIVGSTYAYFSGMDDNQEMVVASVSAKELKLVYSDGQNIDINDVLPGATIIKRFSVKNTGTDELEYTVYLEDVINEFGKKSELVYSLESDEGINLNQRMFPATDKAIAMNVKIPAGETHNYSLKIHFININDYQDANMNKQVSAVLQVDGRRPPELENSVTMTVADGVETELRGILGLPLGIEEEVDPEDLEYLGHHINNTASYYLNDISQVLLNNEDVTETYMNNNGCLVIGPNDVIKVYFNKLLNDTSSMFYDKSYYKEIDVSNFDTSQVTDMFFMFAGYRVDNLNLSNFDTSNVTNMEGMFKSCEIVNLDLGNFDTSNVTNMKQMFESCEIVNLDLGNFDTCNVTDMSWMFSECSSLTNLDVSNFDTSSVTDMSGMFEYCESLVNLDVSNFDTSSVTDMYGMFDFCESLVNLDLGNFDTSNVTDMSRMFYDCTNLTNLDVSNFDTSNVTNMRLMFYKCSSLTNLDVSNFDTSKVTNMYSMFSNCSSLTSLYVSNFDTSNVTDMRDMFEFIPNTLKLLYNSNKLVLKDNVSISAFNTCDIANSTCEGFLD